MDVIFLLGMDERFKEYPKLKELIRLKVSCTVAVTGNKST